MQLLSREDCSPHCEQCSDARLTRGALEMQVSKCALVVEAELQELTKVPRVLTLAAADRQLEHVPVTLLLVWFDNLTVQKHMPLDLDASCGHYHASCEAAVVWVTPPILW